MARPKSFLPRDADRAFMAAVRDDLVAMRSQRRDIDKRIDKIRWDIVNRVERALWNRYRKYHKGIANAPSYFDWLVAERRLDMTYHFNAYHTRLRWVYRVIQTAKIPELALYGESKDQYGFWYFDMLEIVINRRQPDVVYQLRVYQEQIDDESFVEPVPTVRFEKERYTFAEL
jgi:hypothetical protein